MNWKIILGTGLIIGILFGVLLGIFITLTFTSHIIFEMTDHIDNINVIINETKLVESFNETLEYWSQLGEEAIYDT